MTYILKQTWKFYVSVHDHFLPPDGKRLKGILKKHSQKNYQKNICDSPYSANLQIFKLGKMLNTVFPQISDRPQISAAFQNLISAWDSVTDSFLGIFSKIFRTAMLKNNRISYSGYSKKNRLVNGRLNKECFKSSNI